MNIAQEYLLRRGVLRDMLSLPFTLFVQSPASEKVVVAVHPTPGDDFLVRHWFLEYGEAGKPLPPFNDFRAGDVTDLSALVPPHFSPMRFRNDMVASYATNCGNQPMSDDLFENLYDASLFPHEHRARRENWLWEAFMKPYPGTAESIPEFPPEQRAYVKKYMPRLWQYWSMWEQHMINFPFTVAPELLLQDLTKKGIRATY